MELRSNMTHVMSISTVIRVVPCQLTVPLTRCGLYAVERCDMKTYVVHSMLKVKTLCISRNNIHQWHGMLNIVWAKWSQLWQSIWNMAQMRKEDEEPEIITYGRTRSISSAFLAKTSLRPKLIKHVVEVQF